MKLTYPQLIIVAFYPSILATNNARQVIVVTGNFSLDGEIVNIAQYDVQSGIWSNSDNEKLFLYGVEYNGVIWDVAVNHTSQFSDELFLAGSFDTVTKTSQTQLCSVGVFDGQNVEKVGEGLCPRGGMLGPALHVKTTVLGSKGDLFAGGDFQTRLWDGHHFADVYYVSVFDADTQTWLPLAGGQLNCTSDESPRVNTLAWDAADDLLFLGGLFHSIDDTPISSGLTMWTRDSGLSGLPTGGVTNAAGEVGGVWVQSMAYEPMSKTLFVSGSFDRVNGAPCSSIAAWNKPSNEWRCLHDDSFSIVASWTMMLSGQKLLLAGYASTASSWEGLRWYSPYAIARVDIAGYIAEHATAVRRTTIWQAGTMESSIEFPQSVMISEKVRFRLEAVRQRDLESLRRFEQFRNETHAASRLESAQQYRRRCQLLSRSRRKLSKQQTKPDFVSPTTYASLGATQGSVGSGSPPQWKPKWEWLPGFTGGNGPIMRLTAGTGVYEGCVFVAGAFDNYPSVLIWCENAPHQQGVKGKTRRLHHRVLDSSPHPGVSNVTVVDIGHNHIIAGLVTSISQVSLGYYSPTPPLPPPRIATTNYTIFVISGSILVGVVIGTVFALMSFFSKHFRLDKTAESQAEEVAMGGMSLKMLSDNQGTVTLDFKECFERAMTARHLPTHDSLVIINPKEIVLCDIIGEGSFGRVWSGQWRNNSVAVKEFVFAQAAIVGGSLQRSSIIEEIVGEAGIMSCLRHPKILQLYGCSLTMQAIWIVSELCVRGSLRMVLVNRVVDLPLIKKLSLCMDVADGMNYLHTRVPPIIHRDLKSHNIFVTEPSPGHFVAKIGDWGSARAVALSGVKSMTHGVGTACWLAPEVINNAHFSKYSDVYAYGIVLWEVCTRQEVYEGLTAAQIIAKVAHEELRPHIPRSCPWAKVMTSCWNKHVHERPDFSNILVTLSKIHAKLNAIPSLANSKSGEFGSQDHLLMVDSSVLKKNIGAAGPEAGDEPSDYHQIVASYQTGGSSAVYRPSAPTERSKLLSNRNDFHPSLENLTTVGHAQISTPVRSSRHIDYASDPHNYRAPRHGAVSTLRLSPQKDGLKPGLESVLGPADSLQQHRHHRLQQLPRPLGVGGLGVGGSQVLRTPPPVFLVVDESENNAGDGSVRHSSASTQSLFQGNHPNGSH